MTDYLVKGLIPQGHLIHLFGTLHSGKSWIVDHLGVCVALGNHFLGELPVTKSPVILYDEDTPTETLESRLDRFARGLKLKDRSELKGITYYSLTGFRLTHRDRIRELKNQILGCDYPPLVIIDSLSGVSSPLDLNATSDALKISEILSTIKELKATVVITHVLTFKKESSYKDFDFMAKAMGNTLLNYKCDTAFGTWRIPVNSPTCFKLKPLPRRQALDIIDPIDILLREDKERTWVKLILTEELTDWPTDNDIKLFPIFYDEFEGGVQDIMSLARKYLSEVDIRVSAHKLEAQKCLIRKARELRNRYILSLHPDLVDWKSANQSQREFIMLTEFQEELLFRCGYL